MARTRRKLTARSLHLSFSLSNVNVRNVGELSSIPASLVASISSWCLNLGFGLRPKKMDGIVPPLELITDNLKGSET